MDGAEYTQSTALLMYAGKLGGLYPKDAVAALKVRACVVASFGIDYYCFIVLSFFVVFLKPGAALPVCFFRRHRRRWHW